MSEMIKPGDRVRITVEGEWDYERNLNLVDVAEVVRNEGLFTFPDDKVTVEKIEPPVEVFKPGDVVRGKIERRLIYALDEDGYTYLSGSNKGSRMKYPRAALGPGDFTSKVFEKVDLPA